MFNPILEEATLILEQLRRDINLCQYVDPTLPIPKPYRGAGEIKLIVLGQDPTINHVKRRSATKTVLNLDKKGGMRVYLSAVCSGLGIDLKTNVYATNVYKNFFVAPPTQIDRINIFDTFAAAWLPLLRKELAEFTGIPVITLGEPILRSLSNEGIVAPLSAYWGYTPLWRQGRFRAFSYLPPEANRLRRMTFPFPHQPSLRKSFYKFRMSAYVGFVRTTAFAAYE
jgi:hypothetical protein